MEDSAMNNSSRNTGEERTTHDDDDDDENENEDAPEESGWTVYFDDFFTNNRELVVASPNCPSSSSSSGFSGSPSLVSDAASVAAWNKLSSNLAGQSPIVRTMDKAVLSKKLRLLKKKGIVRGGGAMDIEDALEDTASSPVNSPKVTSDHLMMNKQFDHLMNTQRRNDDHTSCSSTSLRNKKLGGHFSEMQTDERNDHHHHFLGGGGGGGGGETECTDLKKKGLCLVPMSMLVNYFG